MITAQDDINQKDILQVSDTIGELINSSLQNPLFINNLMSFLESSLVVSNFSSPGSKLQLINFLDKINRYKEKLEIERGNINLDQLKKTAARFGRKAQSAFDTEID